MSSMSFIDQAAPHDNTARTLDFDANSNVAFGLVGALSRPFISSRAWGLKRSVGDLLKVTV
jgi:hypothetical protein